MSKGPMQEWIEDYEELAFRLRNDALELTKRGGPNLAANHLRQAAIRIDDARQVLIDQESRYVRRP